MTRHVDFVDGFTSASPPATSGTVQENYTIDNNVGSIIPITGLILDKTLWKTVFMKIDLERSHVLAGPVTEMFRQAIDVTFFVDGDDDWNMTTGNFTGDDMVQSSLSIVNPEYVSLAIDVDTGQINYVSGFMVGDDYEGKLNAAVTRISK